ncbi:RNase H domain-containing protein [Trichonephila clavipes]|nr:RNase H domain-containing protein [Trichonephila clavipes]
MGKTTLPDFIHKPCPWTPACHVHYNLMPNVNKMSDHPELLKQLALEVIDGIPLDAAKIYTDGTFGSAPIHLQWVPSQRDYNLLVGLLGNEVCRTTNYCEGGYKQSCGSGNHMVLTSTEICSRAKELICRTWVVPPVHPWYFQRHPGSAISFKGSRLYQTAFSRFSNGHLRCMNFEGGKRSFPICPKCNISPFSPQHILQCLGFSCEVEAVATFYTSVLRLCTDLWTHGYGLVSLDQMGISPTTTIYITIYI